MAKALWALQQYGDALWGYKEAVRLAPENAEYRMQLAEVLFIARDYEGVGTNVDVLLEADPGHIGALLLRAKVARVQAGVDREFEALEAILGVDADHTGALAMKAQALATRGDTEAAEEVLQQLIQIEPGLATHLLYGAFLSTEDRGDEALLQFQAAVEAATEADERTRARLILTHFHLNRGEADAAEAQLLKAREETPDNANILLTLAQFYALRGQPEQAEAMLEERVTTLPDDETPLLVLADFHRRMGDHEKALESVERALALDPRSEQARLRKAEYLLGLFAKEVETEKSEEAKRLIEEVLEENPNSSLALFTEGKLLISEGRYEEAGTRLRRVVEEQPTANAHVLLGSTYLNLEQYELARGEFLRALQLDSAHHLARVQLVALYLKMGDRTLAAREAQAALERRPGDTQMLLARAEALTGLGQQEGALAALRSIEFDEKASEQLRLSAAGLYRANGALDDARKTLEAIRGGSDDPEVVAELARVDVLSGDAQAAIHRLDQAIARSPENVDLYQYRGSMYLGFHRSGKLQFPEEAERDFRTVLEKDIGRSEAHVLLGALYRQIGREEEALESYRSALQIDTTNSDVYLALATLLEAMGRLGEAAEAYESSIRFNQDQAIAKNNLAWILANAEKPSDADLDRALELAQDAKEALPQNPSVADTLGWVMFKKELPAAAISLFREAIEGYPDNPQLRALVRYHLARTYERNGEPERAIAELKRALAESATFHDRAAAEALLQRLQSS
jgi:tetratricopeptide (TPR) repeat protein